MTVEHVDIVIDIMTVFTVLRYENYCGKLK